MSLKELLGEELYQQVQEKIGDEKIAIVSDGSYIPKEKFDDERQKVKDYKTQLEDRDTQLENLKDKAKGNEDLQAEIDRLKNENDQTTQEYEKKLAKHQKESKLDLALREAGFKYPDLIKGKFDLEKINLSDNGDLIGYNEQLAPIKENYPDLLKSEEPAGLKGRQPHATDPNKQQAEPNPFNKDTFNMTEAGQLVRNDPDKARKLISQAGGNPAIYGL